MNLFLPRGIRNNNPGNIRLNNIKWQGQRHEGASDKSFVEFTSALLGLRALMVLLLTYYFKYELDNVEAIVNRYAPPNENTTDNYIHFICTKLKVKRQQKLNLLCSRCLSDLAKAIVLYENGKSFYEEYEFWYSADLYQQAAKMALGKRR